MLAWMTTATGVTGWQLQQCRNRPSGCRWEAVEGLAAEDRETLVEDLQRNQSQCWQVQVQGGSSTGAVSNIVCR